ncbi:T9SS type A sorting domain-containing protein [Bacteroides salyersiae]|mgnify:CR=1 FL=1|uniref:choice-of-anchor Q domain-containing protein n=1 Tax=Bacteroides salyersiae TaxID=291644 RepID=UPI001C015619|nr:choice-of-anchor Q domain-containing protein [Bacteroides salyersiae]MBT9872456.1 T9SS type A sorting domain-containing protein [Bacteroides salyersiae]
MKKHLVASLIIAMACSNQLEAKSVYVKLSSDTEAWSHIVQDADNVVVEVADGKFNGILSKIASQDRVWVAKGVYQVTGSINLNEDRAGVHIYGGFNGNETSLEQRILKDRDGNGIVEPWEFEYETKFQGNTDTDPSYRILTMNAEGDLVDGITICDNTNVNDHGAGAYLKNNAVLSNCIVRNIKSAASKSSAVNGTGIFVDGAGSVKSCLIENCENQNDDANGSTYGGGVNIQGDKSIISNSVIRNNHVISNNNALGGGIFLNKNAVVENCVIYNNSADFRGGGVYIHTGGGKLINVTVTKNMGAKAGGGVFANGKSTIYNTVFWGNVNEQGNANNINLNQAGFVETFAYCGIQGAGIWMDNKNLNDNPVSYQLIESNDFTEEVTEGLAPRFIRPTVEAGIGYEFLEGTLEAIAKANWGLQTTSDLIDKGVNTVPDYTLATTDICGNARPVGDKYDLGAYELGSGATGIISAPKEQGRFTLVANGNGVAVYGIEGTAKVNVYNVSGMLVKSAQLGNGETISLIEHGVYFLSVSDGEVAQSGKILF